MFVALLELVEFIYIKVIGTHIKLHIQITSFYNVEQRFVYAPDTEHTVMIIDFVYLFILEVMGRCISTSKHHVLEAIINVGGAKW